jgi:CPA2 family monovalent cation:H+ antiporter-2
MHVPQLLVDLSASLVLALVLGLITQRLRLSPIVGYLLAGIALGPATPGYVSDKEMAQQFAEIGVVLLMFGVGMHFDVRELLAVKGIAIPGAIAQITVATLLGLLAAWALEWTASAGLILGIAVSVASTVVLIRVLMDNDVLHTTSGHIAVGWLIVEDIFTVLVLVVLSVLVGPGEKKKAPPKQDAVVARAPADARNEAANADAANAGAAAEADAAEQAAARPKNVWLALAWAVGKISLFVLIVVGVGRRVVPWLLRRVAETRSRELFTLAVFALALGIATGSAAAFQVSMPLGAFLAGMVVRQTEVSHQAAADALPMRDAFAVLFFVSVGMLFDPAAIGRDPWLLASLLGIVLIAKPLTALVIVWALRYSVRSALTVAVGLAQIGEFSFLLADQAVSFLSEDGRSQLVACALITITANPLLFRALEGIERWLRGRERLWQALSRRSEAGGVESNLLMGLKLTARQQAEEEKPKAVVVGYGPVGQTASRILREFEIRPVVIDLNLDTIRGLAEADELAIYGDATRRDILISAGIRDAKYLLVTVPDVLVRTLVILAAKELNPGLRVLVRARYIHERAWLEEVGADEICTEEAETALGLATVLLREVGADEERVRQEIQLIERELGSRRPEGVQG